PRFGNGRALPINIGQLVEWRKHTQSFEGIGAYRNATFSLTGSGTPELISGSVLSANFFDVLGVRPRLGRLFEEQEDHRGQSQVVLIADSLWRRRFSADPSVVGRKITLGGAANTIVGVLPPDFDFPRQSSDGGKRLTARMEIFRPIGYAPEQAVPHNGD